MRTFDDKPRGVPNNTHNMPDETSLLGLPPELRDHIYECAVALVDEIIVRDGDILVQHPLALASKAISQEFVSIFKRGALEHADCMTTEVTDFDFDSPPNAIMIETSDAWIRFCEQDSSMEEFEIKYSLGITTTQQLDVVCTFSKEHFLLFAPRGVKAERRNFSQALIGSGLKSRNNEREREETGRRAGAREEERKEMQRKLSLTEDEDDGEDDDSSENEEKSEDDKKFESVDG